MKLMMTYLKFAQIVSHPVWVRGLKLADFVANNFTQSSHPVWVRGLKQSKNTKKVAVIRSHPVWVRGLKHRTFSTSP